jgi:hypothetical protein
MGHHHRRWGFSPRPENVTANIGGTLIMAKNGQGTSSLSIPKTRLSMRESMRQSPPAVARSTPNWGGAPIFCHQQTMSRWNLAAKAPSREIYVSLHVRRTPPPASAAWRTRMKRVRFRFVLETRAARRPYLWMQSHIHSIACGIGTDAVARIRQITSLDARKLRSGPATARASGKVAPRDHRWVSQSWASKFWDFQLAACVSSNCEHKVDKACP